MNTGAEYRFEKLNAGNLHLVKKLFAQIFQKDEPEDFFLKKYDTGMFGHPVIGYFAFDKNGSAVAYYGIFPCRATIEGKPVLIAQSGDSMTMPEHQRKGLFTQLAQLTYADAKNAGIQFIYGFPNKNSRHGLFDVLKWKQEGVLLEFSKRITTLPLAVASYRMKWLRNIYGLWKSLVLGFFKAGNRFSNPLYENCITRDDAFFNYKKYSGSFFISAGAKSIFLKEEGHLKIGDMEFSSGKELKAILKKLSLLAFLLGTRKIIFIYSEHHPYVPFLKKHLSFQEEGAYGHFNLTQEAPSAMSYAFCDSDTF